MPIKKITVNNRAVTTVENEPKDNYNLINSKGVFDYTAQYSGTTEVSNLLDITDIYGNSIAEFSNGHIILQQFDSETAAYVLDTEEDGFYITDADGYVIASFDGGDTPSPSPTPSKTVSLPADVLMVPCYGQSLSVNAMAGPSTFTNTYPLIYNTNLVNTNIQDMCAGFAEGFKIAANANGLKLPSNLMIVSSADGAGGISVNDLSRGSTYYSRLISSITTAKNNATARGLTFNVPAFMWTQGEEDMRAEGNPAKYGTDPEFMPFEYHNRLQTLINQINEDVKTITGQTNDVVCISYQTASHTSYCRYPRIALEQAKLARIDSRMLLSKIPYDVEYVRESNQFEVHMYARSYRNLGNLYGVAAFNHIGLKKRHQWVFPIDYTLRGTEMIIRFDVPYPPLVFDTVNINNLPDGNYGFNVYNVNEQPGAAGSITESQTRITSVNLLGNDTVCLTFNRTPQSGDTITYAINGDYWQNIAGTQQYSTGEVNDGVKKAGYLHGSRGCLRDSSPIVNNNPGAVFQNLYNWCEIFEIKI